MIGMDIDDLKKVPFDQLRAEMERRQEIASSKWPKPFTVVLSYDSDEDDSYLKFLEDKCGFTPDSPEFNRALMVAGSVPLMCEVEKDGTTRVVGFMPDTEEES